MSKWTVWRNGYHEPRKFIAPDGTSPNFDAIADRLNAADEMAELLQLIRNYVIGDGDDKMLARIDAVLGGVKETKEVSRGD